MSQNIISIPTQEILIVFIMICRVTGVFFLVPPFSDTNVKVFIRIGLALSMSIMMQDQFANSIRPMVKVIANDSVALTMTIISELLLGISLGLIVKTIAFTVQVAGLSIASQIGLSAAAVLDQSQQMQNSTLGILLSMLTTIVILESGMHIKILSGVYESYNTIPVGDFFSHYNDFTSLITSAVSKMWSAGIQISMPFIVINIAMMIGAGILAKLMPQLQIFFVMLPVQIMVGIIVFTIVLSGILVWFLEFFSTEVSLIF